MRRIVFVTALLSVAGSAPAQIMSPPRDLSDYGYVQDLNLDHGSDDQDCDLNDQSCAPTSWTNSLVYLQNTYGSELAGLELAGDDLSAWAQTVGILRSPAFMNTSPNDPGTTAWGQVDGIETFLTHLGVGPMATSMQAIGANFMLEANADVIPPGEAYPEWLLRGAPTLHQLNHWLETGAVVVIDVLWETDGAPNGNGHVLALVGVEWHDANDNTRVDQGEAFLHVIDPLDPTHGHYTDDGFQPVGPARTTPISVWQDPDCGPPSPFGLLNISYQQYKGNCGDPYDSSNVGPAPGWLSGAGALNIIGGPGGSCCLATGCDSLTQTACEQLGGLWTLAGSCDDCEPVCPGDLDNNGFVNIEDLLSLIGAWGACP